MCAVQQQSNDGTEPFGVIGQDITIKKGVGGVAFSNIGGALSLDNLNISDCDLVGGVSTGSSSEGSIGVTMIRKAVVMNSSILVSSQHSKQSNAFRFFSMDTNLFFQIIEFVCCHGRGKNECGEYQREKYE